MVQEDRGRLTDVKQMHCFSEIIHPGHKSFSKLRGKDIYMKVNCALEESVIFLMVPELLVASVSSTRKQLIFTA